MRSKHAARVALVLVVALSLLLVLSGCTKKVCETNRDCNDGNRCTVDRCVDKGARCENRPVDNCCGNGICEGEEGENQCTCANDCGQCSGSSGPYLSKSCIEGECVLSVKPKIATKKSLSDLIDSRKFSVVATYTYPQPFDVYRSLFNLEVKLDKVQPNVELVTLKTAELYTKLDRRGREISILGSKTVDKTLWSEKTRIVEDIPLTNALFNTSWDKKEMTIKLSFTYLYKSGRTTKEQSYEYEKTLGEEVVFVRTGLERKCPESCDDNDPCTVDSCSEKTGFFCVHEATTESCCGNFQCDEGENECTCAEDCGSCSEYVGNYMEYACVSSMCISTLRDQVSVKPKTIVNDKTFGTYLAFQVKATYDEPFINNVSVLKVELEVVKAAGVSGLKFKRIQVIDSSTKELLGEKNFEHPLQGVGDSFSDSLTLSFTTQKVEEQRNIIIKLI